METLERRELSCDGKTAVVDFGKDGYARLDVTLEGTDGQVVQCHFGEALRDGVVDRKPFGSLYYSCVPLTLKGGLRTYQVELPPHVSPWPIPAQCLPPPGGEIAPFRYVELEGYVGKATLIRHQITYDFDDDASSFVSDNEVLNQVWELSKYTMKATSAFGRFVDGDRERLPYEADALINQLGWFCCTRNPGIARETIDHLFLHPTWPTEWFLQMPLLVRDYLLYTGDKESVAEWLPQLPAKLLPDYTDQDGLLHDPSIPRGLRDIVDWPQGERDGYEFGAINFVPNCFLYMALLAMFELTGQAEYLNRSLNLRAALRRVFRADGRYVDCVNSSHTSLHTAMMAIESGIADQSEMPALGTFLQGKGMACSVYGSQFLIPACYKAGLDQYALDLLTSRGIRSWYNMIVKGATITMEAWDNSFKPNQDWNHAWGAAPANLIPRYVCGIRPTSPGYATFTVEPHCAGLRFLDCRIPTPDGSILFHLENGHYSVQKK